MQNQFLIKLYTLTAAALLPVLNLFVFGTFNLYSGNSGEFEAGYGDLLFCFLPAALACLLLLAGIGVVTRQGWWQRYVCLLLGLGVLIWIQGAFLVWDYGVLDGRGLDWMAFAWPAWLDVVLWISVLAAAVVFHRRLMPLVVPVASALVLIQGAIMGFDTATTEENLWNREPPVAEGPPGEILRYSTERNIVHVVLDNFQTDVFEELVEEQDLSDQLDGFVLFRENSAVAPYTSLAVPSFLSGRVYDGSIRPGEFYRQGIEEGFHAHLYRQGYSVNLMPLRAMEESPHTNHYRIPAVYRATRAEALRREAGQLLDVTLFRHVPHLMRGWVYNQNNWRLQAMFTQPEDLPKSFHHKRFFREYITGIELADNQPAYHFIHLWPPHPPYVTTPKGQYSGEVLPNEREYYFDEARDVLLYFMDLLQALKDLGIYDETLILLHSDHGGSFEPDFTPTRILTLNAVKSRNSSGPLRVSNAPVSLADVARTILVEEGLEIEWTGRSVFQVGEDEARARQYVFYHGKRHERLKPVVIEGSLYSPESYTYLESISLEGVREIFPHGERVEVGLRGAGGDYLDEGWSSRAPGVVWSDGRAASLRIPIQGPQDDLLFVARFIPNVHPPEIPRQRIIVEIAGQELDTWQVEERRGFERKVLIPSDLIAGAELVVTFRLPDARSPAEAGVGGDRRLLGIALMSIGLEQVSAE